MKLIKFFGVGLLLVCLLGLSFTTTVHATGQTDITLTVQQTIVADSTPSRESVTYRLISLAAYAPMPVASTEAGYTFTISGNADREVGPIAFATEGIFIYELYVLSEDQTDFTKDRRVYTIEVHVTDDLRVFKLVSYNGNKSTDLDFTHIYSGTPIVDEVQDEEQKQLPRTGIESNTLLWLLLLVLVAIVGIYVAVRIRKF